jgi:hypothetical protein
MDDIAKYYKDKQDAARLIHEAILALRKAAEIDTLYKSGVYAPMIVRLEKHLERVSYTGD